MLFSMPSFRPSDFFGAPAAGEHRRRSPTSAAGLRWKGRPRVARGLAAFAVMFAAACGALSLIAHDIAAQPRGDRPMLLTDWASVERLERGRHDLFQLDLRAADQAFYDLARTRDGAPAAYYHLALSSLLDALLTDRPAAYDRFFARSDSLKDLLGHAGKGPWRELLQAETDAHRALAWAKRGQYVRAAMAVTSASNQYREIRDRHPDLVDARKGSGVFEAMIGALPDYYRRFLTVLGFPGEYERGTGNLLAAARSGGYFADEASLYLGVLGMFEFPVPVDPVAELESIYRRRGQSPLAALPYLEMLFRARNVATADSVLADVRRRREAGVLIPVEYFTWFEAESAFRRNRFDEAAELFGRYVVEHPGKALKAMAWLRLGAANDQLGRRAQAVEAYRQVVIKREYESDAASARQATRLAAAPPSRREKDLVRAANAFDRNDLAKADSALAVLRAAADLPEALRAEVQYRSGRLAEMRGLAADAIEHYRTATRHVGDPRDRWIPTSWLRIGMLEAERGRKAPAIAALERVLAHPGEYDYRGQLRRQAEVRLESLK